MKKNYLLIAILIVTSMAGYYFYSNFQSSSQKQETPSPISKKIPIPGTTTPTLKYGSLYKPEKNTDQKWQESICVNLSQEQCENNDNCNANYTVGPCIPEGGCVNNFDSCGPSGFNSNEIQQIKTECDKINGELKKKGTIIFCTKCDESNIGDGDYYCLKELIQQLRSN